MEEYQRTLNQNRMQILKSHIEKVNTPAFTENAIPEESKYISVRERENREKIVNELFLKHKVLPTPAFQSTPFLVSPLIEYEGYFDGASRGNPGISSVGCLLQYLRTVLLTRSELLGTLTNNQAELTALGFLMAESYCNGVQHLRVMGDSKLAIECMKNNFEVRHPNLLPLFECNQTMAKYFQSINYIKIKREDNKEADRLANEAYLKLHGGRVERWR